jgi:CHASE2 domain-containing sensor protein
MSPSSALQALRSRLAGTHRVGEIGALISIVLAIIFFATTAKPEIARILPIGRELRYLSYDIPFIFRPKMSPPDVEIILLDEPSHIRLEQTAGGTWHRALHVQLLKRLKELGAAVIVIDILLDDDWVDYPGLDDLDQQLEKARGKNRHLLIPQIRREEVDVALAKAAVDHGKVVAAARITMQKLGTDDVPTEFTPPFEALHTNAFWGITELELDRGFRRAIRQRPRESRYPSLAQTAAELWKGKLEVSPEKKWINYYGPPGTLRSKSYYEILQADGVRSNYYAGKIVFIGLGKFLTPRGETHDDYPTPFMERSNTPGVEIQATICLNFLRNDWLTELSPERHLILFVASGVFFGVLFAFVRPWISVALAVIGFLGVAFAGIQTVWQTHTWFSWLIIGGVQIPAALGWSLLINTRRLYQQNLQLEEALKTATATPPATGSSPDAPTIVAPAHGRTLVANPAAGALPRSPDWVAQPGDSIGDYHLVRCVGEGAYGQVWLARNAIGTYAALKLVYRKKFRDDAPFEREFQGLKRFMPISRRHAGFVQILHVGKSEGFFYYVMEAGDDETTQQAINPDHYNPRSLSGDLQRRGKLPLPECLKLAVDLSDALGYLHQQNLIHRDIKPSNIIFVTGQPKIADIGLVTVMATSRTDATYIGTPGYIPPEGPGTAAADVYSLGKVIYEASMGRHVANYPALPTTLIERDDYKSLVELNDVIIKACADNVTLRYQTAADLYEDLVRLQTRLAKQPT